jgi:hypothetical protein
MTLRSRRTAGAFPSYVIALMLGAALAAGCFPAPVARGRLPAAGPSGSPDFQQHVSGQLYLLAQNWHWPLLVARKLDAPFGTNVALTDSIPLELLLLKLLHPFTPGVQQGIGPFLVLCWILQPVCAVFALRAAGERRLLPALAAALLAACLPTFLGRMAHAALCAQWILLLAVGLYFHAANRSRMAVWLLATLVVLTLVVHPYLMVMAGAVLCAVPVTLFVRDRAPRIWLPSISACTVAALGVIGLGSLLGYWGAGGLGGYGVFSMNLASPFWPSRSSLFPWVSDQPIEVTGGQYEGYQYLGAGVLLLVLSCVCSRKGWHLVRTVPLRHAGLLLAALALTVLAASNRAYLFHVPVWLTRHVPPGAGQLRASGRLFWPVAYLLLVGGVFGACRAWPRLWPVLLLAAMALQWRDTTGLRTADRDLQHAQLQAPLAVDARLDTILRRFRAIEIQPRLECDLTAWKEDMRVIYLAATHDLPVNTMYAARPTVATACHPEHETPHPLAPDTLLVLSGPNRVALARRWRSQGLRCGLQDELVLCAAGTALPDGLQALPPRKPLPAGQDVPVNADPTEGLLLESGWSVREAWGTWTDGPDAVLVLSLPAGTRQTRITLRLHAAPLPGNRRTVRVQADGQDLARWSVGQEDADYSLVTPPIAPEADEIRLHLAVEHPMPVGADLRLLGVGLSRMRLDPEP